MGNLKAQKEIEVRFSEVDSMNIVWHGSYPLYFEDAREEFGRKYGLGYMDIFHAGYFAPLVELSFKYLHPITYGMEPLVIIRYIPTPAAKIIFEYEIKDRSTQTLLARGRSVQVFTNKDNTLVWYAPDFYQQWKQRWGVDI